MKYNESIQYIQHSWTDICSVFYRRYPNPHSKHVLSEDIVKRTLGPDNVLKTTRIFAKTNEVPGWLLRFLPTTTVYILEESHVDVQRNVIATYTRNLTHKTLLSVEERCVFSVDTGGGGVDTGVTRVERRAWIKSFFIGLSPVFERFGLSRYNSNIQRMHQGFSSVLKKDTTPNLTKGTSNLNYRPVTADVRGGLTNGIKSAL